MRKGPNEAPRMLPYVVQAVTDLKDLHGSTMRKILDQVHTAINITNVKPKPRNVVMQVKRALKHAVDSGALKHKAGKYRLGLDTKLAKKANGIKARTRTAVSRRRRRRQRKTNPAKLKKKRRRGTVRLSRCTTGSSVSACSTCGRSITRDSYNVNIERNSRSKRRRRRSLDKKTVKFSRTEKKSRNVGRCRRVRKPTPMPVKSRARRTRQPTPTPEPMNTQSDQCDEFPEVTNEITNFENVLANNNIDQEEKDVDLCPDNENPRIIEIPPECDNPECLCNLKQETTEDDTYENLEDREFYQ